MFVLLKQNICLICLNITWLISSDLALVGMLYQGEQMFGNQNQMFGQRRTNVSLKGVKMFGFLE